VQQTIVKSGLGLKVWDGYRPFSVQKIFWDVKPDPHYIAQPKEDGGKIVSGSKHNRGAAVDLTLVDDQGHDLMMPSYFDEFSEKAHRSYDKGDPLALANRECLCQAMMAEGFTPFEWEWWHFDGPDWETFPLCDLPIE